jgi:diadenylate cyclase
LLANDLKPVTLPAMFGQAGTFLISHWKDGIEILIISVVFYGTYRYLRRIRGARILLEVLIVLVGLTLFSRILDLPVLNWLIRSVSLFCVIGLIVIFQPELRRAVVELERFNIFSRKKERADFAEEMWEICRQLSAKRFGALFAIQRGIDLKEFIETGVRIDAELSAELVLTIFHPKTVLHDGGMILKNGRIEGAACVFPVSQRELLDRSIGLRHRAALGLSEQTDAILVIVSEETGHLSLAYDGELERNLDPAEFVPKLQALLTGEPDSDLEPSAATTKKT